jgi:hypothetical protein
LAWPELSVSATRRNDQPITANTRPRVTRPIRPMSLAVSGVRATVARMWQAYLDAKA